MKLNKYEKIKLQFNPYEYSKELGALNFDSLGNVDRQLLGDVGIFSNPMEEDEFILRLRISAGHISPEHLELIATIVREYELEIVLTARAQLQLHGLFDTNILEVFYKCNEKGLCTYQTFGDNVRNIVCDVYDGINDFSKIEVYPYIKEIEKLFLKVPEYIGLLPRRLSTAISGNSANVEGFFSNDIFFALAVKDNRHGFNLYLGGKNSEMAQDSSIFVYPEELVSLFEAIIVAFNKYGLRANRTKTRLFHLIEEFGMDSFKNQIQEMYDQELISSGELLLEQHNFKEFDTLSDGTYSYMYKTNFARVKAEEFEKIASIAKSNNYEVRIGTNHHIYILGLKEPISPLKSHQNSATILACAGSEYCPYSYWSIKDETSYLPMDKITKHDIKVGFSGCLKGCAKHQHSDIGVVGLRTNIFGEPQMAARIFLGAEYTYGKVVAKEVLKVVPLPYFSAILDLIIHEFEQSDYSQFELFSHNILNHFTADFLELWFLAKMDTQKDIYLHVEEEETLLNQYYKDSDFYTLSQNRYREASSFLSKKMWTIKKG